MSATITQKQPDISYHPDYTKYKLRTERLKLERTANTELPEGFPKKLTGPIVWEGKDLTDEKQWTFSLKAEQLSEINDALAHFKTLNKPIGHVSQTSFPLPTLGPRLRERAKDLQTGRGFFVLRGLRPDDHTIEGNIIIYAGVSSYIGSIRGRQDNRLVDGVRKSQMLNHIKDLSQTSVAGNIGAPAYTTDKQVFHTDAGDIVSLFCLNTAAEGGESMLASSWRVYNELAETRPDIVRTLAEDWVFNSNPPTTRPLLFHTPQTSISPPRIIIQYARRGFTGFLHSQRSPHLTPITEPQAEALDALHFHAEQHRIVLDFQKGDVQYVNNLSIFHARDGFVDDRESGRERHLLRLWLRDEELAWDIPGELVGRWVELYGGVTEEEQVFPLEPRIRGGAEAGKY